MVFRIDVYSVIWCYLQIFLWIDVIYFKNFFRFCGLKYCILKIILVRYLSFVMFISGWVYGCYIERCNDIVFVFEILYVYLYFIDLKKSIDFCYIFVCYQFKLINGVLMIVNMWMED